MTREEIVSVAVEVDRLILESRLRDVSLLAQTDRSERVGALATVVSKLKPGAYLIGCGPYCGGVLPLTVDEVVLGRPPSPLEQSTDTVVDYGCNDAVWLVPREVSRVHATILRHQAAEDTSYWVRDENSRTGTFVNGQQLGRSDPGEDAANPRRLAGGDVISLGPSGTNTYVFVLLPSDTSDGLVY